MNQLYNNESISSSQQQRDARMSEWTGLLLAYTNAIHKSSKDTTNHDLNTSFSVASYHMRQRKLLRQITLVMKQLAQENNNSNHRRQAGVSIYTCYFLKSSTNFGQLSLLVNEGYCSSEHGSNKSKRMVTHDLVIQILDSVYNVLVQECVPRKRGYLEEKYEHDIETSHWISNAMDEEEARENLVTSLEFLDAAFTCLDCDLLFQSLGQKNSHHECDQEEDENTCGRDGDKKYCNGKYIGNRIVNVLLEFITSNGSISMESIQDWDDVQKLSVSVLTKIMICVEYIQMYCSSKCYLPREGLDSLLGIGMGLGLEDGDGINKLQGLGQIFIKELFGGNLRPSWTDGRDGEENVLFQMSCIGLLSVLHRTALVPMSSYEYSKVISYQWLLEEVKNFQKMLGGDARDISLCQFAYSSMVVSLMTMLSPVVRENENHDMLVIESDMVAKLLDAVFSMEGHQCTPEKNDPQSGATQVLIHLCWSRHGSLQQYVQNHGIENVVETFLHSMSTLRCGSNGIVCERLLFAMIYLNQSLGCKIRKTLKHITGKENCGYLENVLKNIIDSSRNRFASFVPTLLFLKTIIFQNGSEAPFKVRDQLADDTLDILHEKFSILEILCHKLSYYKGTGQMIRLHMTVDALHFFQSDVKYKMELSTLINEETTASLLKVITGTIDMKDSLQTIHSSLQITSASILCYIIMNTNEDNQGYLKKLLFQFATNSIQGNTSDMGALEYALSQTLSRDLLRRALNFQSTFSQVSGEDAFHMASTLFSNAIDKSKSNLRLVNRAERQQKDLETMHIQNQRLLQERDSLLMKLDRARQSFDRELILRISAAKADAIDVVEGQIEEKKKLEMMVSTLENKLSIEQESMKRALTDAREEREIANRKLMEYEQLSNDLQNRISINEETINEKDLRLIDANAKIEDSKRALERSLSENKELAQENNLVKAKLEETLIQLISLTQIFTAKEKERKSEQEIMTRELNETKLCVDKEVQKRHLLEEKYSMVKGKYQALKERYEEVVKQRNEERSRYEQDLKKERMRRQDDEMKSKRRNDLRKPMGTIDFVNSFHDTSVLRSDRSSKTNKSSSGRIDGKSGRSGFRIVK